MDLDKLAGMAKIVEEQERLERQAALYGGGSVAEALRLSKIGDLGATYAAQLSATQQIEAAARAQQLATSTTVGAIHGVLYSATEQFAADPSRHLLTSSVDASSVITGKLISDAGASYATQLVARERLEAEELALRLTGGVTASSARAALSGVTEQLAVDVSRHLLNSGVDASSVITSKLIGDAGASYATQLVARERLEAEELALRLTGSATASAAHAALGGAKAQFAADASRHLLTSGVDVGTAISAMQIAEEARHRQDMSNLLGGGVAASLVAADEARLRTLVDGALGVNYLTATGQTNALTLSYADQMRATAEGRFLLPGFSETERMLDVMRGNYFSSVLDRYGNQLPDAQAAMLAMQAPWLDSMRTVHSIRGFAELQAIGGALDIAPSFGDEFSSALRADLGDWRDPITNWSQVTGENADTRRRFYIERGFNTDLTDFPDEAFDESLTVARIKRKPSILVIEYGELTSLFIDGEEDEALVRTNVAHNHLQRLEFQLRKFIDQSMTKAYGAAWTKRRMPNGLNDEWIGKKSTDTGKKTESPLIVYADFRDYESIICRTDNWKEVFAPTFKRKEDVRESFQRLYPIRLAIAHARPIDKEEALLLYVEANRLLKAMQPVT